MSDENATAVTDAAPVVAETAPVAETAATVEAASTTEAATATDATETAETAQVATEETPEPVAAIVLDPFEMPEGVTYIPEEAGAFTDILSDAAKTYGLTKEQTQELGQKLVSLHAEKLLAQVANIQSTVSATTQERIDAAVAEAHESAAKVQAERAEKWEKEFNDDPDFGGKRRETTLSSAKTFIKAFSTEADAKELTAVLNETGLGNNPALIRLLARAGEAVNKQAALTPGTAQAAKPDKLTAMYGPSTKGK